MFMHIGCRIKDRSEASERTNKTTEGTSIICYE